MARTIKPFKNKGECLELEHDDLLGITQLCIDSLRRHGGKQAVYSVDELQRFIADVESYFETLRDHNEDKEKDKQLFPSIESLCVFLGISRNTLNKYSMRNEEWRTCIEQVRTCISSIKVQLATHGRIPALVHVFDMVNNFGYLNTSEFRLVAEKPQEQDAPRLDTDQIGDALDTAPMLPELPQ